MKEIIRKINSTICTPEEERNDLRDALKEGCNADITKDMRIVNTDGQHFIMSYISFDNEELVLRIDIDSLTVLREIIKEDKI